MSISPMDFFKNLDYSDPNIPNYLRQKTVEKILDSIKIEEIEQYLRKKKLEKINK